MKNRSTTIISCNMANHIETLGNTYLSKIAGSDSPEIPSRGFVDAE